MAAGVAELGVNCMANFKVVISDPKSKKAVQKEMEQKASGFMGKRIGDKVRGEPLGLAGYEFEVTGGSDAQGFPMRKDVEGMRRKKVLLSRGTGFRTNVKGQRKRRSVRGNTISDAISQINAKIVAYGSKPVEQLIGKTEKKKEFTVEEKKAKLHEELSSKVDDKAPEKSRSDQIREEMEARERTESEKKDGSPREEAKPAKEEKPEKEAEAREKAPEHEEKPKAEEKKGAPREEKASEETKSGKDNTPGAKPEKK